MNDINLKHWLEQQPCKCVPSTPCLFILMGLSGSGKSTVSRFLTEHYKGVWINSDVERQRLYGKQEDMYAPAVTARLFEDIAVLASGLLQANYPVVIDSCALKREERNRFTEAAKMHKCPVVLLFCTASDDLLKKGIRLRLRAGNDQSQATPELIDFQKQWFEPPSNEERRILINIKTFEKEWQATLIKELSGYF